MALPTFEADAQDTQYTITFPKEFHPYLRDLFYPAKMKEGETIEQYIVRVIVDKGIETYQSEAINSLQEDQKASFESVVAFVESMRALNE